MELDLIIFNTYHYHYSILKLTGNDVHFEILYKLVCKIFIFLKLSNINVLQFFSLLTVTMFFIFIRKNVNKKYWILAIFIFYTSTIYFDTFNLVRQYTSIAIMLYAFEFLKKEEYLKYIICLIIATGFHYSAFICIFHLLFYIFFKNNKHTKILKIVYFISLVLIFIDCTKLIKNFSFLFPKKYLTYFQKLFKNKYSITELIIPNIMFYFMSKERKNIVKKNKVFDILYTGYFINIIILNAFYGVVLFGRLSLYFQYFIIIIVPILVEYYDNNVFKLKNKIIKNFDKKFLFIMLLLFSIYLYYRGFILDANGIIPYRSIFSLFNIW